ncbi:MAG: phage tail tape measure protein, partial [Chloroflexota bacterium]|nr:phage tail tape measure protein [Chloroflexota bacterium]
MAMSASQLNVRINTEGAAAAKRDINDVGDAVDNSAAKSRMLGTGFLAMGTAIAGGFAYGATQAISFGEQMANVNSIAQLSTAELAALSDEVIALGSASGQSPQVLAAGLYDIASSGFAGAEGMQVLEASSRAATAGMTTTDVAARGVTAALNAYGLGADDAAHISDVMFQTVNEGVITFEQLSNNMGNTLPLAKALGVSFEELGAGYAQMTLSGVGASQAETQIAALMRAAINPTTELTEAVQAHGYASVESLIATEGLTGYLDLLTQASGGTSEGLFALLGTAEATNAALLLGGENADEYAAAVERMEKSSEGLGATQTALNKQMESTAFSLKLLKTNVQAAAIAIGVQLEPGIRAVAKAMTAGLKLFLNLSKPIQRVIGVVTALVGVLSLAAGAWILFGPQITMAAGLFLSLLGPIALVVAAVAGLYVAWKTNFLGIRKILKPITGVIERTGEFAYYLAEGFKYASAQGASPLSAALKAMNLALGGEAFEGVDGKIRAFAEGLDRAAGFVDRFMDAWNGQSEVMDKINDWGGLNLDGTTKSVMDQVNAWGGLTEEMSLAERAMAALDVASGGMITNMRQGFSALKNVGHEVMGLFASGDFSDAFSRIGDIFQNSALGRAIGDMVVSIPSVAVSVGKWVMGAGANLYETVKPWVDATIGAVSGIIQQIPSVAVSIGSWLMEAGANLYDVVKPWIDAAISAVSGIVQQ